MYTVDMVCLFWECDVQFLPGKFVGKWVLEILSSFLHS
jgi:hypothetical protein